MPKKEGGLRIPNIFDCTMARHLWDLDGFSMVKWCHIYMLRNQSLWSYHSAHDSSWTWQKLMKLRDSFHAYIKYRIGTGEHIFTWYDNWHSYGPSVRRYGARPMYDTVSSASSKLSDYIINGQWHFPNLIYGSGGDCSELASY